MHYLGKIKVFFHERYIKFKKGLRKEIVDIVTFKMPLILKPLLFTYIVCHKLIDAFILAVLELWH